MQGHSLQRHLILDVLQHSGEHPTALRIAEALARGGHAASTSNLYRNLTILVAEGRVRRLSLDDGPDRFDANLDPHYHVTCIRCNRVWDVAIQEGDRCDLALPEGFRPGVWEITVRGTCAACARGPHPFES